MSVLAPKKKKPTNLDLVMAKVEEQSKEIEALLKQLLDEAAANRSALAKIEDAVKKSSQRIMDLEKKTATAPPPPPPPPPPKLSSFPPPPGKSTPNHTP